jgi:DNA-binding transcriptional LysR family regulator
MPSYILGFQRAYPEVQIDLEDGTSEEMAFSVLYGQNDMAVVARMSYDSRLESMPFPGHETDRLVAVVHPKHPLARRKKVALAELKDEPLLLRGKGSGIRELVLGIAKEQGITLSVLLEAGSADFIKAMVAQGAGVSVLTTIAVSEAVARGIVRAIPLSDTGSWLNIDILMRKEGYRPIPVRLFTNYLQALTGPEGRALTAEPVGRAGRPATTPKREPAGTPRSALANEEAANPPSAAKKPQAAVAQVRSRRG